jgi:collagenase-like PrtC family protease
MNAPIEIVCPAGTLTGLKAAVDNGADTVYVGFNNETNARNFPGLNLNKDELREGIEYAHAHNAKVYVAINTFARAGNTEIWKQSLDDANELAVDAVIIADIGILNYSRKNHPTLRKHLSVQASASSAHAINFYSEKFDIKRVVLPRVLTINEIESVCQKITVETEVFAFGGLCVMAEGKCLLSSYVTGEAPNTKGVCSPASHVRYENTNKELISKLDKFTINKFDANESAGYPTLCKGRFKANNTLGYLFDEPSSLNIITMIPRLIKSGVKAIKIEGRQRGQAYVSKVVSEFRKAVDQAVYNNQLSGNFQEVSEGQQPTTGAFDRVWL